ncbi:unnamed protein product [Cuscuta europaea]|uniref:Replication factor A C-terminal domain-containing protein n=1 Tax=Cuscuta europaea TaxID=41803 RepID=A0A9P0ZXN7_CUSEU|nr:unnamed protein product [Cuscuta europaea]
MVGMWSLFREIDQSKTTWAFKARAIHVYREPAHDCFPESLEIVFHDEEGSKMHAHIPDQYINTFIGIFKEGRVFAVKNIMVEENYMFFKTTTSAYRLCFFNKSAAFEIKGVPFLSRTFSLVSFASLQALDTIDEQYRIDNSNDGDIVSGQQELLTIEELNKLQEDGEHWVYGETVAVDNFKDWSYVSCIGCNRKVSPNGDSFWCAACSSNDAVLRYKVNVRVVDGTSHASFLLWDREVSCLLGKSATSLKEQITRRNFGPHHFPSEINSLIDIKALFRVQFKRESRNFKGNQTFSVMKMNTDPKVLALYSAKINGTEEEDEFSRLASQCSGSEKAGSS